MKSSATIVQAVTDDAMALAVIHKESIAEGFLSTLPLNFLKLLYRYLIKKEIVFVSKNDKEQVVAFVSATEETKGLFKRFVFSNLIKAGMILFFQIFRKGFLSKVRESMSTPFREDDSISELPELLSIAVTSKGRGHGLGTSLLIELETELKKRNVRKYKVIAGEKLKANDFYLKQGFSKVSQIEIHKGEISNIYTKDLI